ncbi:MAG: hypothetical protein ABIJ16_01665 [Bacteroidota bacterium]
MEAKDNSSLHTILSKMKKRMFIGLVFTIALSSCQKGFDGRPGDAYLGLQWEIDKPSYVDAGPEIPPTFIWGDFYYACPGTYFLYYEGEVWTGWHWARYAWEVEYEIWRMPGEPGGYGYNGYNGPDTYLQLICSPYGPHEDRFNLRSMETGTINPDEAEDIITFEEQKNDLGFKVTYRKVEPRGTNKK